MPTAATWIAALSVRRLAVRHGRRRGLREQLTERSADPAGVQLLVWRDQRVRGVAGAAGLRDHRPEIITAATGHEGPSRRLAPGARRASPAVNSRGCGHQAAGIIHRYDYRCRSGRRGAAARRRVRLRRRRGPAARGRRGQPGRARPARRTAGRRPAARAGGRLGGVPRAADLRGPWGVRAAAPQRVPRRDRGLAGSRAGPGDRRPVLRHRRAWPGGRRRARRRRVARRRHRPGRGRVRPAQRRAGRRPRLPGRPVRPAAAGAARPRRHPDLQRAVRAQPGGGVPAPGGSRLRAARRARRRPRRAHRAPQGRGGGARLAGRWRRAAGGDQRPAGAGHDAGDDRRGADRAGDVAARSPALLWSRVSQNYS